MSGNCGSSLFSVWQLLRKQVVHTGHKHSQTTSVNSFENSVWKHVFNYLQGRHLTHITEWSAARNRKGCAAAEKLQLILSSWWTTRMDCGVLLRILLVFLWIKPTDVVSNTGELTTFVCCYLPLCHYKKTSPAGSQPPPISSDQSFVIATKEETLTGCLKTPASERLRLYCNLKA